MAAEGQRKARWTALLNECIEKAEKPVSLHVEGRLTRMVGLTLEAVGCQSSIGGVCKVEIADHSFIEAEVVGFSGESLYLMPTEEVHGLVPNARVIPTDKTYEVAVGDQLLGRVLDGSGAFLDAKPELELEQTMPLTGKPINPMHRAAITQPLDVGVRAINSMLSVGRGQRLGLFAGSGVGKSVLLGMMTKFTAADVIVVGLIGERGREVKEFIDNILGTQGMQRAVVVAAPADNPPLMRIHGAMLATTIAEYYRDQGKNVLLLMDSLTRFAQAQREIALAIGEPPATKGYPPSVFAKMPQLVERAGNSRPGGGSITAFYTVLAEGDDQSDPIVDAARAILDGHIVLSRELAESGHYPAIDIEASISRVMNEITTEEHQEQVRQFRKYYSTYQKSKDLISVGAYSPGHDANLDEAVAVQPALERFLQQHSNTAVNYANSLTELQACLAAPAPIEPQMNPVAQVAQ
jgi:flagellum-specific ATP synthase